MVDDDRQRCNPLPEGGISYGLKDLEALVTVANSLITTAPKKQTKPSNGRILCASDWPLARPRCGRLLDPVEGGHWFAYTLALTIGECVEFTGDARLGGLGPLAYLVDP